MSTFTRFSALDKIQYDPVASKILGKDHWRVLESFRFYVGEKNTDMWVDIPAGYLTDGASVPRIVQNIVGPWGRHGQAAIVHDFLCEYLTLSKREFHQGVEVIIPYRITRKECDDYFLEAMTVLGVKKLRRNTMWVAVSLFRRVGRLDEPSLDLVKFGLEKEWRVTNNLPEPTFLYFIQ
jgi:hypothetical protein